MSGVDVAIPKVQSPISSLDSNAEGKGRSEALRKSIRITETEVERDFQTFHTAVSQSQDGLSPEIIRLKQEVNKRVAACERKTKLLARLKEQVDYPVEGSAFAVDEIPDSNVLIPQEALQPLITKLQTAIEEAQLKTVHEDHTTDILKTTFEKVTHSRVIMKQRSLEVQQVLERVSYQLMQAKTMGHIATNFLTLAHSETHNLRTDFHAEKERFNDRYYQKLKDRDTMAKRRRKTVERLGTARFQQGEVLKQKQSVLRSLDVQLQRHQEEKHRSLKAQQDIQVNVNGFRVIANLLKAHGYTIAYESGMPSTTIATILTHFNMQVLQEGSLSSRYNSLTWDFREKEDQLHSLRCELASMQREGSGLSSVGYESQAVKASVADDIDQLCLRLYSDVVTLLSHLHTMHQRVVEKMPYPESPDLVDWEAISSFLSGSRAKPSELVAVPLQRRSISRSNTLQPRRSRVNSVDEPWREDVSWGRLNGVRLTANDLQKLIRDARVQEYTAEFEQFFRTTLVVKHFADATTVKHVLNAGRSAGTVKLQLLVERCHVSFRSEFKAAAIFCREVLQYFLRTLKSDEQLTETHPIEVDSKRQKELVRLRLSQLSKGDSTPSPRPRKSRDEEAVEFAHITALRSSMKSGRPPAIPVVRRSESALGFIRKDAPMTERAKVLLKNFLMTERKLSVVRDKERITFKVESLRTPMIAKHHRVQTAPNVPRKPQTVSWAQKPTHARSLSSQVFTTALLI